MSNEYEKNLTEKEMRDLTCARAYKTERQALENYVELWESLDNRLGTNSPITKCFVDEYWNRSFPPTIDHYDSKRIDALRLSFVMPRRGVPKEVLWALMFSKD